MSNPSSMTQSELAALDGSYLGRGSPEMLPMGPPPYHGAVGLTMPQPPHDEGHELQNFWKVQMDNVLALTAEDMRIHCLPLARIKKIMKSDEDVRMISAEAPVLFSKACEIFILELTRRAWNQSEANKRRTLQRSDIAAAITSADVFDFLVDIVPRDGADRGGLVDGGSMEADVYRPSAPMFPGAVVPQYTFPGPHGVSRHGLPLDPQMMSAVYHQSQFTQRPATTLLAGTNQNTVSDCASGTEFGKQGDGNPSGE